MLALSRKQGFVAWVMLGTILRGWALAAQGQLAEGVAQMREGLAARQVMGHEVQKPYWLALLAEGYGRSGQPARVLPSRGWAVSQERPPTWIHK